MTFTRMTTSPSRKFGRSTQSAVDIFNTLHVFTKDPIREQEIKGTSHDSIFQISLFSTLADVFAVLETPPMY